MSHLTSREIPPLSRWHPAPLPVKSRLSPGEIPPLSRAASGPEQIGVTTTTKPCTPAPETTSSSHSAQTSYIRTTCFMPHFRGCGVAPPGTRRRQQHKEHNAGRDFEGPMRPNVWAPSAPTPPDMLRIVECIQRPYAGGPVAQKRMSQLGDARDASRCIRHGRKTRPSVPCTPAPLPLRTN